MSPRAWMAAVAAVAAILLGPAPSARADERADAIATELGHSGLYVTDHAPREISSADGPRLRALVAKVPTRAFLAVTPSVGVSGDPLVALLHDRLGVDGVYIVMGPNGLDFNAVGYGAAGAGLPVKDAVSATVGLPYDDGPLGHLGRFVDVVRMSPAKARTVAQRAVRSDAPSHSERRERAQDQLEIASTAVGAVGSVALVHWRRIVRRRRRAA